MCNQNFTFEPTTTEPPQFKGGKETNKFLFSK